MMIEILCACAAFEACTAPLDVLVISLKAVVARRSRDTGASRYRLRPGAISLVSGVRIRSIKWNSVPAPEQFAIKDHGRHAEYAERLGFRDDAVVLLARRSFDVVFKRGNRAAELGDDGGDFRKVIDLELVIPEAAEHRVMIGAEES